MIQVTSEIKIQRGEKKQYTDTAAPLPPTHTHDNIYFENNSLPLLGVQRTAHH